MNKTLGIFIALIVIGGGLYWYAISDRTEPTEELVVNTDNSSAMRAGENMIVVMEQKPGNTVTASQIHIASSGFVVIRDDLNNEPNELLGTSALLQAGENSNIDVTLSRATQDGEKLHAQLYADSDNSGTFTSADARLQALGSPIDAWFDISSTASNGAPITL